MRSTLFNDNVIKWTKAKVCVYADSVPCVGEIEQNPGAADAKWTGQIEDLKRYPSYQDAVGLDGEAIEFEWTISKVKEIQMDLERKNIELENFKDLIIFMSMFNDIGWKKNDDNCISNAEKVKNYSKRFLPGHWTFLDPGSEKRWFGSSYDGQRDRTANNMVQQFKETGHPIFTATSALSRGILKRRNGKSTIHFNGDFMNTEQKIQTINSMNQVSIYAAVSNWCYNFVLKEEKKHNLTQVNNRIMAVVEPEEVDMLISFPNQAQET